MSRIVLTCSSDNGYAPHATVMLLSALRSTPRAQFVIHYLIDPDFPEATQALVRQSLARFGQRAELHFHTVPDEWVQDLPLFKFMKPGEMRPVMWYRVFLPRLLPQEPKILYLDCDTLVVDSLEWLWRFELGERALAAVSNPFWDGDSNWYAKLGLQQRADYFNSGVMLLNLDRLRAGQLSEAVLAHGREHADWTRFGDQDSLVAVLHGERLPLPPRWNAMRILLMAAQSRQLFTPAELRDAIRRPAIIHFEGSTKPWVNPTKHPYGRLHVRYARRLPWPVNATPYGLDDIENFLTRRNWQVLRNQFRTLRSRLTRSQTP